MDKKEVKEKRITRTFRHGKSVHQLEFIISLRPNIAGTKYFVYEQRAQYKDEKPIFTGTKEEAEAFFLNTISQTFQGMVLEIPFKK